MRIFEDEGNLKEVIAQKLHTMSQKATGPLRHCMSSPRSLRRQGKLPNREETLGEAIQREIPSPQMAGRAIRDGK
ncbi:MAG: hypothetical protein ACRC41_03495 [Sarcina sp.]